MCLVKLIEGHEVETGEIFLALDQMTFAWEMYVQCTRRFTSFLNVITVYATLYVFPKCMYSVPDALPLSFGNRVNYNGCIVCVYLMNNFISELPGEDSNWEISVSKPNVLPLILLLCLVQHHNELLYHIFFRAKIRRPNQIYPLHATR